MTLKGLKSVLWKQTHCTYKIKYKILESMDEALYNAGTLDVNVRQNCYYVP